ncbi:zinc ribbon domain-containing protein (plasmid) [Halobacterium sp. NMX12-1]|uniref:Zinc ribbon domain-containing protein n=1 Tax=Halobacterium sp. NMX12-1 TaxID=3166650 RepID=A0AAU8CJC6_9EURY
MSSEESGTEEIDTEQTNGETTPELGPDEVYCTSCGEVIKDEAEVCPECGVRQKTGDNGGVAAGELPDSRVYELQKVARKSPGVAVALGFLLAPAGYWYVGRTGLAAVNFLTLNYLLLGIIIVPFHSYKIIKDAREELEVHGESW